MSGSLKMPLPNIVSAVYEPNEKERRRYSVEQRAAAVKLLMALYNEYPLRQGEEKLMDNRIAILQFADRGWFALVRRECGNLSLPTEQLLAGLTLLE